MLELQSKQFVGIDTMHPNNFSYRKLEELQKASQWSPPHYT